MRVSASFLVPFLASALAGVLFYGAGVVRADDPPGGESPKTPEEAPPPKDDSPAAGAEAAAPKGAPGAGLEFRLFDVGALAGGFPSFQLERGPFPSSPDQVNDENAPLYGREAEMVAAPCGTIDDVIERLLMVDRKAFATEGSSISAAGTRWIAVVAPSALQAKVAAALGDLERDAFVSATLDVVALRGEASTASNGGLAAAIARGDLVPLAGARSVGFAPQSVVGRSGADQTFVSDEDTEVAEKAQVPDPIVAVAKEGLAFQADLQIVTTERVAARVSAWWGALGSLRRVNIQPSGDPVERIESDGRSIDASLDLVPGVWTVLASTGDVAFAVRASVRAHDTPFVAASALGTTNAISGGGPLLARTLDLRDFQRRAPNARGRAIHLAPSNYTPIEPPELPDDSPALDGDSLVAFVRTMADPEYWSSEGADLSVANGRLRVVADEAHGKAVAERVDALRARLGRATRLRTTVVSLPVASIPEYFAGLDDGATLLGDGGQAVLARAGATIVDRGGVRCRPAQRSVSVGGREVVYVGEYDVEIAQAAIIGNPIMRSALVGYSCDVGCRPAAGGAAVACDLRLDRSTWNSSRDVKTEHGDIECPTLGISRLRGSTVLPIGSLRIVGATLERGIVTLTILSANAD